MVPVMLGVTVLLVRRFWKRNREFVVPAVPEAPPDLAKLRPSFDAGLDAILRGDGAEAVSQLSSFTFGKRAVDQYRRYYLANACQLAGDAGALAYDPGAAVEATSSLRSPDRRRPEPRRLIRVRYRLASCRGGVRRRRRARG
jgi:hypothetical protein